MKKIINKELRTTALFKCVVELKNGTHIVLRGLSTYLIGRIIGAFRSCQASLWHEHSLMDVNGQIVDVSSFRGMRFVNESTRELLIAV